MVVLSIHDIFIIYHWKALISLFLMGLLSKWNSHIFLTLLILYSNILFISSATSVKIGLKPGNRSTWESHKCSGTQWEQFINTETNLLAWNTMRAVEELSLCPGIVEGAQNAAITEELYRRSPRRQKKRKKKLQVQPCIGWSSNYWSYGLGKKCYRVLEYYRVHI